MSPRRLLLAVCGDEGGVELDPDPGPRGGRRPSWTALADRCQRPAARCVPGPRPEPTGVRPQRVVDPVQDPPCGGGRGNRAEQLRLVSQHGKVGDRRATVSEHHRQIDQHPTRVVSGPTFPQPGQHIGETGGHAGPIGEFGPAAGSRRATPPPTRRRRSRSWDVTRYGASAECLSRLVTWDLQQVQDPKQDRHFRASTARVAPPRSPAYCNKRASVLP